MPAQRIESSVRDGVLVLELKDTSLDDDEQVQSVRNELVAAVAEASCDVV